MVSVEMHFFIWARTLGAGQSTSSAIPNIVPMQVETPRVNQWNLLIELAASLDHQSLT